MQMFVWSNFYCLTRNAPLWPRLIPAVSLLGHTGDALNLGCGAGRDTRYLLEQGFMVTAVDREAASLATLADLPTDRLRLVQSAFEDFTFEQYDLINGHFALPFTRQELFATVFARLKAALKPGSVFMGQFFGVHGTWNTPENDMTFLTHDEALHQLKELQIVEFEEEDQDGTTADSTPKHWHDFHIIARQL